ncbi:hypothetical protein F4553_001974 [Allocatelliglobosispora scoriae]|uniref:Uncharacterized protein n=1 Tax=Allocatelliglobosispora scoriae TaxID=643052 RepID=A0A841BLR8_9ACTN|nr:hypothetical protein [Allocatelliglobosispora scoriae]
MFKCLEFVFDGGNCVFADPTWHFGLRLGVRGSFDRWVESNLADLADGQVIERAVP